MDPQEENHRTMLQRIRDAAIGGGVSGAGLGGIGALLSGQTAGGIAKASLKGAIGGGIAAPAAIETGRALMGPPSIDEKNQNTRRGALGGALLGGAVGLAGTALLHKNIRLNKLGSLGEKAEGVLGADNVVMNAIRDMAWSDSKAKQLGAYGLGGGTGALAGAHLGADEGMGQDIIQNELDSAKKRKMRKDALSGSNV